MFRIISFIRIWCRRIAQVLVAAGIGFWKDDCYTKASTLTFYTLQSIVPLLAAVFAIAKGFGFEEYLENLITTSLYQQREVLSYAIQIAHSMLDYIQSGVVVGIGVLFLLWTNLNLVGYVELALNEIWKVKTPRSFFQKLKDFSASLVILPTVFVVTSSLTVFFKTQIANLDKTSIFEPIGHFTLELFRFLPLGLSCLLFFLLYLLIPNTKLRVWPRLVAALIAGSAFQLWQIIYIHYQIQIFSYNVVYGAFALLPLFFIWLQLSWLIALAGAEIAAHIENFYTNNLMVGDCSKTSKRKLSLLILHQTMSAFYTGSNPLSAQQIALSLKAPLNIVQGMLDLLVEGGILVTTYKSGEVSYLLLKDPSQVRIKTVCDLIDKESEDEVSVKTSDTLRKTTKVLSDLDQVARSSNANISLSDYFRESTS